MQRIKGIEGLKGIKHLCHLLVSSVPSASSTKVLWHKWIGLIEQPYAYDGNLTRPHDFGTFRDFIDS